MQLLNYKKFGSGKPLVILHGFLGSLDNWLTLGKRFAEQYEVFLVDQRNHGKSFHSNAWGYDEMVEDLEYLFQELALDNPILLGHSMGGKTVMQYAALHPGEIEKLIVADIKPFEHAINFVEILKGLTSIPIEAIKSRAEADEILQSYVSDMGTRSFLLKNLGRSADGFHWKMNLEVLAKDIRNIGKGLEYHSAIDVETLFIRGGRSGYITDEDFEEIQEVFPVSRLETVSDAGHWLHAEQPDVFFDKVMDFLNA